MTRLRTVLLAAVLAVVLMAGTVAASAQPPQVVSAPPPAPAAPQPPPEDKLSTTKHSARIGGQEIHYTATAGTLVLKEEDGRPRASVFFVAYTRDGAPDPSRRPITFTFNGGPGSSSVWLHLGAFGPRRVFFEDEGTATPPPYRLIDNDSSLLDVTDLVFIDPVSTGYSRPVPGVDPRQFHGLREDIESVGEFIRLYCSRFNRWSSPKLLAGESYGTTRAAALANYLQERHGMYLNGIVLVSSVLNFQMSEFDVGNDMPSVSFLPTYTATAWYHKRLPPDLQSRPLREVLAESERYALGDYLLALARGDQLQPAERRDVAAKVARLTGLSPEYVEAANLRPNIDRFVKELMRNERKTVGRLDSRFEGIDRDATGQEYEYDPSYAAISGPFTAMLNDYLRRDLGFQSDLPYEILTDRVFPWRFQENRYENVAEDLRQAMSRNPALRVFVASGYYDLATPYFGTEYTFHHLAFDPGFAERITRTSYEAGHMMYIRKVELAKLKQGIAAFLQAAVSGPPQGGVQ